MVNNHHDMPSTGFPGIAPIPEKLTLGSQGLATVWYCYSSHRQILLPPFTCTVGNSLKTLPTYATLLKITLLPGHQISPKNVAKDQRGQLSDQGWPEDILTGHRRLFLFGWRWPKPWQLHCLRSAPQSVRTPIRLVCDSVPAVLGLDFMACLRQRTATPFLVVFCWSFCFSTFGVRSQKTPWVFLIFAADDYYWKVSL